VRFLIDNALSPLFAKELCAAGHDAVHVLEIGLDKADDETILAQADADARIVVTVDTDFAALLAELETTSPSVILFRHKAGRNPIKHLKDLLTNLSDIEFSLAEGSIVIFQEMRIRIRRLPILKHEN